MKRTKLPPPRTTGASMARHDSKQDYSTPDDFLAVVRSKFGPLTFDLAADEDNCKANRPDARNGVKPYFTSEDNSLSCDWNPLFGTLWLNPPFNDIKPWVEKCAWESSRPDRNFSRILLLVPASVGSEWFAKHVFGRSRIYMLIGRLSFDGKAPYPKDTILCSYPGEGVELWRWRS